MTPKELAIIAAKALDEKKGKEISAIQVTEQTTLADYFVFATGSSNTQINALCGAVEKALAEQAGATVVGAGIAIEKAFQGGGDLLRSQGLRIESLAKIASMGDDGSIRFC